MTNDDDIRLLSCRPSRMLLFQHGQGTLAAAFSLSIVATLVTVDAQVGIRRLTVDDIYSPSRRVNFSGAVDTGITWLDASTYLDSTKDG